MDGRPNTSSYHAGDTSLVGLLHRYAYRGDSCNAEGYLNKVLAAIYVNIKAVRFVLIEQHIRALSKPYWKQGDLRRDAYKIIMRKTMDEIIESAEASKFPKTKSDHQKYLSASERKIFELIQDCYRAADCTFIKSFIVGGRRVEELQKESEKGNVGVAEVDESSTTTSNNIKAFHQSFFRIEHIRDLLKPYWKQGNLSRDACKIIMNKSIDKIIESIEASKFPKTKSDHQKYLSASERKIFELIQECYRVADRTFIKSFIVGGRRLEELQKESEKGNVGVAEVDESSTSNNIKAVHSFKFFRIEHIRDLLRPYWEQGNLSRDAYEIIMKKSIDKIIGSIEASKFPKTKSDHQK